MPARRSRTPASNDRSSRPNEPAVRSISSDDRVRQGAPWSAVRKGVLITTTLAAPALSGT